MPCDWCLEGKCRNSGDETTCDFKTLKRDPISIKNRMDEENQKVMDLMRSQFEDMLTLNNIRVDVRDRLEGIKIMKQMLSDEFKMDYKFTKQLEMTKAFIDFMAKGKRLERKKK
jgi:very-short-patch-repair endonuclease